MYAGLTKHILKNARGKRVESWTIETEESHDKEVIFDWV
jgi:hypothetical protein